MEKDKFIKLSITAITTAAVSSGLFVAVLVSLLHTHQAGALSLSGLLDGITGQDQRSDQRTNNETPGRGGNTRPNSAANNTPEPASQVTQAQSDDANLQPLPKSNVVKAQERSSGSQIGLRPQTATLAQPSAQQPAETRDKNGSGSAVQLSTNQAQQDEPIPSVYSPMQISTDQRNRLLVIAGSLTLLGATIYVMSYRLTPARVSIPVSIKRVISRNPLLGR